ncbi:MAG: penicillin-binding protein 1C [Proteobacteria bacterium]|nr:MAG: penicillin-binding protein 1C [Pseudomonadota bacterium]
MSAVDPDVARPSADPRRRRRWRWLAGVVLVAMLAAGGAAAWWVQSLGPLPLDETRQASRVVVDRQGRLLRAYAMPDGRWRLPVTARRDVDPRYLDLLFAYEDQRFLAHHGVDPLAFARAAWQWATHGHIVSGGSTITMQVARLLEPRQHRSLVAKLRQAVRALQLERRFGKDEILDLYLTLAPYGGNLEGIRAASLAYFGKEPKRLTLAEAALLVALPQSPERRRLDRHPEAARAARDRVLERMVEQGVVSADDAARARAEPVPRWRKPLPFLAPHSADQAISTTADAPVVRLTLDAALQHALERLARDRAAALGPDLSIGILAVANDSGEVLAHVGSPDYFDERRAGQVDMVRAVRSPGSTLKPFIYGLAFEDGLAHPESLIDDRPVRFGAYAPENFDMTFQGTVAVRKALQLSLNVPAVALLDRVGAARLTARLRQAGLALTLPKNEVPGLAMGLGGVGLTLHDLVQVYAGIPRLGSVAPLREVIDDADPAPPRRLLDAASAWQVGDILLGTPPPENAAAHRIAYKTGTSYGSRDAWAVGFDGRVTVGVWVGRPDGAPVPGMTGRGAAAPVLFDAFARSGRLIVPLPRAPRGTLIASNARLPLPLRRFQPSGELPRLDSARSLRIQFPLDGARLDAGGGAAGFHPVPVKVAGGVPPLTVLVDGVAAGVIDRHRQRMIVPPGPGFVRLTVMDANGAADTVVVRIQ